MPVCIAGMHRSGTSMIARLLNQCGLSLGPEDELLPANEFNTEGYWENEQFVKINDELLTHFGGGWDMPPAFPAGWENRPELEPLKHKAQELVERFVRYEPWGWKDPRSCLTIPFWRTVMPDLKVLLCVRNPLEVMVSLSKRANYSDAFGLALWLDYNQRALTDAQGFDYVVSDYDAYYVDPVGELRRVLDGLDIVAFDAEIERACSSIVTGGRHHRVGRQDLLDARVSQELLRCYDQLLELSRAKGAQRTRPEGAALAAGNGAAADWQSSYAALRLVRLEAEVQHLRKYANAKDKETAMLSEMVSGQQAMIDTLNARLQTLLERNLQFGRREAELAKQAGESRSQAEAFEKQAAWYKSQLDTLQGTLFYRLGTYYWSIHSKLRGGR